MDRSVYEFISQQTSDPIVERKICAVSGQEFAIFQSDLDFYDKISPTFNGQKFQIPTPILCPEERQRRRYAWRNERKLYKRKCDFSGKNIISIHAPNKQYAVYEQKVRWSDQRDPLHYGKEFDFSQEFFPQYDLLLKTVPTLAMNNDDGLGTSENCSYCQDFAFGKNCYMTTATRLSENCLYCDCCLEVKNCVDCVMVSKGSQNVYEGSHCTNIQSCSYIYDSTDSHHCHFCSAVNGSSYCFLSVGLQNKQYYILNKEYDKDAYEQKVQELEQLGQKKLQEMFTDHLQKYPKEAMIQRNSTKSIGNNIFHSQNIVYGFDVLDVQHAKYVTRLNSQAKDCFDIHQSGSPVLTYEGLTPDKAYHCAFVSRCREGCQYLYYCDNCYTCEHCFGCIGLRNKKYCIFNKKYTKEVYEEKVTAIISHMQKTGERGEFPPISLSPFGYNETIAQDYCRLEKKEVLQRGYNRSDVEYNINIPENAETIPGEELPQNIHDIDDTILQKVIICETSKKPFRLIKEELQFYQKNNIPIPSKHPDIRHHERLERLAPRELHLRTCSKTGKKMLSVYPQDAPFPVYSEEAYNQEVYG